MRPAIVTVLTAAGWESSLVAHARATATARVLGRCRVPHEVDRWIPDHPIVVCGSETPWLSGELVERWRRAGAAVAVIADPGDRAGRRLVELRCDLVLPATDPPHRIIARLTAHHPPRAPAGRLATVTGPRGAPGRSEVALALAWGLSTSRQVLLAELDHEAPSLAVRLGLDPGPAMSHGRAGARIGSLELLTGPLPRAPFSLPLVSRLVESARLRFDLVVGDVGPPTEWRLPAAPDVEVIVCDTSPVGVVRAARMLADWDRGVPWLVLNRMPGEGRTEAIRAFRAATGLEPAAILPVDRTVEWGRPPSPSMVERLMPLARALVGPADDAGSHPAALHRTAL